MKSRYQITKLVGQGTFARVFNALDYKYDENVALKIVRCVKKYTLSRHVEVSILRHIYKKMKEIIKKPKLCLKLFSAFKFDKHLILVMEALSIGRSKKTKKNKKNINRYISRITKI